MLDASRRSHPLHVNAAERANAIRRSFPKELPVTGRLEELRLLVHTSPALILRNDIGPVMEGGERSQGAPAGRGTRYSHAPDYRVGLHAPECRVGLSWDASRSQVFSVTPPSRSLYFCTLPLSVVGSSRTNSRYRGVAK